jgi:hypothetical protein
MILTYMEDWTQGCNRFCILTSERLEVRRMAKQAISLGYDLMDTHAVSLSSQAISACSVVLMRMWCKIRGLSFPFGHMSHTLSDACPRRSTRTSLSHMCTTPRARLLKSRCSWFMIEKERDNDLLA